MHAVSHVIGHAPILLNLHSEHAVESHSGLEQTHVTLPEAEVVADLASKLGQVGVIGAKSQLLLLNCELGSNLSIGTSEHIC